MADTKRARALERRLGIEKALAYLSAATALLTLLWRDWIEFAFRVDPDGGSGAVEWAVVAVLVVSSAAFAAVARADRRRLLTILQVGSSASGPDLPPAINEACPGGEPGRV